MSTLSLLGLYNYDNTIFNDMVIPSNVDKDLLIDNLLFETAELEILYTDSDFIRFAIKRWSEKQLPIWDKINNLFNSEYNPIYNLDVNEDETINRDLAKENTETSNITNGSTVNTDGSTTTSRSDTIDRDTTDTKQVTGFNDSTFKDAEKNIIDESITETETGSATNEGTMTSTDTSEGLTKNKGSDTESIKTSRYRRGNQGVTMTQQMIEAEMNVRPSMSIYKYIIEDFKQRFCLLIY